MEEHVKDAICPRCRSKVKDEWKSEFCDSVHYLANSCHQCGYALFFRADFMSNGVHKQ